MYSVAVPDDLDKLMDTLSGGDDVAGPTRRPRGSTSTPPSGWWSARPRVCSSPPPTSPPREHGTGRGPGGTAASGAGVDRVHLAVGDLVGPVGLTEVRTPFEGLSSDGWPCAGERVVEGQPVAWIRTRAAGT